MGAKEVLLTLTLIFQNTDSHGVRHLHPPLTTTNLYNSNSSAENMAFCQEKLKAVMQLENPVPQFTVVFVTGRCLFQ